MASFGHGGNAKEISRENQMDYDKIIDFSANINPLGIPDSVKKDIIHGIDKIEKYPDITYFELKNSISAFENIHLENLLLGNGASEVLFNVVRGINPQNVLIMAPTFSEYEEAVNAVNGNIIYYMLKEEEKFSIKDDILDYLNPELDVIFICNPNNPTGVITENDLLIRILSKAKKENIIVIIDESFLDFLEDGLSLMQYTNDFENLIIIKSLTKFFALPGLRIGYAVCSNNILKKQIEKISPAWNINILAEIAAKTGLGDDEYIKKSKDFIKAEGIFLYEELNKIAELKVYKPSVNYIFFKCISKIDLKQELIKNNILIRSCCNYEGLDSSYYRIAVRTRQENLEILKYIKQIFSSEIEVMQNE